MSCRNDPAAQQGWCCACIRATEVTRWPPRVIFASLIAPDLRKHLDALPSGAQLAFTSPEGTALANTNFRRRVWGPALVAVGLEGVHIHGLRHTGNQFTADAGANPRELMARMGHDSPRAALIYMHSSDRRQRALADAVAKAARAELAQSKKATKPGRSGTRKARRQDDTSEPRGGDRNSARQSPYQSGAPLRNRTVDLLLTISTFRCDGRVSCTDDTCERTESAGSAWSSPGPSPRPGPRRPCSS